MKRKAFLQQKFKKKKKKLNISFNHTFEVSIGSNNEEWKLKEQFTVYKGLKPDWRLSKQYILERSTIPPFQINQLGVKKYQM